MDNENRWLVLVEADPRAATVEHSDNDSTAHGSADEQCPPTAVVCQPDNRVLIENMYLRNHYRRLITEGEERMRNIVQLHANLMKLRQRYDKSHREHEAEWKRLHKGFSTRLEEAQVKEPQPLLVKTQTNERRNAPGRLRATFFFIKNNIVDILAVLFFLVLLVVVRTNLKQSRCFCACW